MRMGATIQRCMAGTALCLLGACSYEVGFDPAYVPDETPQFIADAKVLIVMPTAQQEFVYSGPPDSTTGDFTTLTVPLGAIVKDIATDVFTSCFSEGVEIATQRPAQGDYVVAIEGDIPDFVYRYTKIIDQGFDEGDADSWIIPEVDISFNARAYDRTGTQILAKTYDSGVTAGEGYRVTSRPSERINETLHATLHALMLQLADDIKPLLVGECSVTDIA
jgi:hypothetical protein